MLAAARAFDLTDVASDRPSLRFRKLILGDQHGTGSIRRVLWRAELITLLILAAYVGSDRVMLSRRSALRGKMRSSARKCCSRTATSSGRSMRVAPLRERVGWFNPKRAGAIVLPYWRYLLEYGRSIDLASSAACQLSASPAGKRWASGWAMNRCRMQNDVKFAVDALRAKARAAA